jgi:hypothetical protein
MGEDSGHGALLFWKMANYRVSRRVSRRDDYQSPVGGSDDGNCAGDC